MSAHGIHAAIQDGFEFEERGGLAEDARQKPRRGRREAKVNSGIGIIFVTREGGVEF